MGGPLGGSRSAPEPGDGPALADATVATVAVPALNEEDSIIPCLRSVLRQSEERLQVVVVLGPSTDRTTRIVQKLAASDPRIELLHNGEANIPRSLNMVLGAARGRWLVRVDAHSTIPPDYVRRVVGELQRGGWGGVGGRKDAVAHTASGRAVAAVMGSRFGVGGSLYHFGTLPQTVDHIPYGTYPTWLARALGGWDERLTVNEDFEFDQRVRGSGRELLFDPGLRIAWRCSQSVPALFRQYRRYGRGKVAVARLHPRSVRPSHLAAPALVASWATVLPLVWRYPRLAAVVVAPYVAALVSASVLTARRVGGARAKVTVPASFAAMHVAWGIGFWEGLARLKDIRSPEGAPRRDHRARSALS